MHPGFGCKKEPLPDLVVERSLHSTESQDLGVDEEAVWAWRSRHDRTLAWPSRTARRARYRAREAIRAVTLHEAICSDQTARKTTFEEPIEMIDSSERPGHRSPSIVFSNGMNFVRAWRPRLREGVASQAGLPYPAVQRFKRAETLARHQQEEERSRSAAPCRRRPAAWR
jgi:hypothetical protein